MLGADFHWILCIKTTKLKLSSLNTFKILLDLNDSLECSNLPLLKMMRKTFVNYLSFSSLFCECSPKRRHNSLCNCEYASSKVIIMTFYLGMALVSNLDFRLRRQQEILLIQSWRFHNYLYSVLVRLMEHLFFFIW